MDSAQLDEETAEFLVAQHWDATLQHMRAEKLSRELHARNKALGTQRLKTRWGLASAVVFGTSRSVEICFRSASDGIYRIADIFYLRSTDNYWLYENLAGLADRFRSVASDIGFNRHVKALRVISAEEQAEYELAKKTAETTLLPLHTSVREWMAGRGIDPDKVVYKTNVGHALQKIARRSPEI